MASGPEARLSAAERVLDRLVAVRPVASKPVVPFASEVIRDGAALLVRRGPVLVRVRPNNEANRDLARREVQFASMFEAFGVPVTPLVEPADQPWIVSGNVVTAWSWVEPSTPSGPNDLGLLARTLRERTRVAVALVPRSEPLAAIEAAVAHLPADDADGWFVRRRAQELAEPWAAAVAADPLGQSVVHGDLHRGNVVDGSAGPMLTDLELTGTGGASYDAAPAVIDVGRYGGSEADLEQFLSGFGSDPRTWPGFVTYLSVYELWTTAWAVGVRHLDPRWAAEAAKRVATLRDGVEARWSLS